MCECKTLVGGRRGDLEEQLDECVRIDRIFTHRAVLPPLKPVVYACDETSVDCEYVHTPTVRVKHMAARRRLEVVRQLLETDLAGRGRL